MQRRHLQEGVELRVVHQNDLGSDVIKLVASNLHAVEDSRVMPGILILIDAPRSPIAAPQRVPPSSNS
jgi:hypothetical protein